MREPHAEYLPAGTHKRSATVIRYPTPPSLRDDHAPVECLTSYCTFTTSAALY